MAITVTRTCIIDDKEYSMELDITQEQLDFFDNNRKDVYVQHVFPKLNDIQREFLISGMPEDLQQVIFGNDKDDQFDEERSYE